MVEVFERLGDSPYLRNYKLAVVTAKQPSTLQMVWPTDFDRAVHISNTSDNQVRRALRQMLHNDAVALYPRPMIENVVDRNWATLRIMHCR